MNTINDREILIKALERIADKSAKWEKLSKLGKLPKGCNEFPFWNLGDIARSALKRDEKNNTNL